MKTNEMIRPVIQSGDRQMITKYIEELDQLIQLFDNAASKMIHYGLQDSKTLVYKALDSAYIEADIRGSSALMRPVIGHLAMLTADKYELGEWLEVVQYCHNYLTKLKTITSISSR